MPSVCQRQSIVAVVVLFLASYSVSSFALVASQNPPKETYQQQLQQLIENTDSQAKSQFDKSYPKPSVPKTPTLDKQTLPQEAQDKPEEKKSSTGWQAPQTWQQPQGWQQPGTTPDSQKNNTQNQKSNQNIYTPGGTTSTNQTPNPYK
jgi:hypothetical protein